MHERALLLTDSANKQTVYTASATKAAPTLDTDGIAIPDAWKSGGAPIARRFLVEFAAAAALNLTAINMWVYVDAVWIRVELPVIANITFAAALSAGVIVEWLGLGTRLAFSFTVSISSVTVRVRPIELLNAAA